MTFFFNYVTRNRISKRRKSLQSAPPQSSQHGEDDEQQQQQQLEEIYPTFLDLPTHILMEILSRLPLKAIFILRCVCKTLCIFISDPDFARLHLNRANVELFLGIDDAICISRTLHLVDPETMTIPIVDADNYFNRQEIKINARFHLPKRDSKKKSKITDGNYDFVNSCNGFFCLCKPCFRNPCIVCNPITGEYITIPKPEKDESMGRNVVSAFGYSSKSNQYKVLRLVYIDNLLNRVAEVFTLGTSSWRRIGYASSAAIGGLFSTYLNGVIHWACDDLDNPDFIIAFDFDEERFCVVPAPIDFGEEQKKKEYLYNMNMGVLGGCLSICDSTSFIYFDIWVMKDYGVQESWTKQFAIDNYSIGPCRPIKYLGNGDLLMFYKRLVLAIYNPVEKKFRYLRIREARAGRLIVFEAIAYTPSFLSLKDAVGRDDLEVHYVRSGCAESELKEEDETLFLGEINKSEFIYYS